MQEYIKNNKAAWEESFAVSKIDFGAKDCERLQNQVFPFVCKDLQTVMSQYNLKDKHIGQMCCNNGREIMSIVKGTGAKSGVGFDIAENIIQQANEHAKVCQIPCNFICCNVLEIEEKYHEQFDAIFILVGAICWLEDLEEVFKQVAKCLKKGGHLFIQEIHPCTHMLAVEGEDVYDPENKMKIAWSYFKTEPFIDDWGQGYMAGETFKSKPFISFAHKMSDIINGIVKNNMHIKRLEEYDYDIGGEFKALSGKGYPMSYILVAEK